MELVLAIFGFAFGIVGLVCDIIILIHAFRSSVGEGFLCLCVPFYGLYYMFAKFEHEQKGWIIAGSLGGGILGGLMNGLLGNGG